MSNPNCIDKYCYEGCCNMEGYCPKYYSFDYAKNSCFYYYSSSYNGNSYSSYDYYTSTLSSASIIGIAVGCFIFIAIIIIIVCVLCKRNRQPTVMPPPINPDTVTFVIPGTNNELNPYGRTDYLGNNMPYNELNANNF
jgi:hypothetical protein